MSELSLMWLGVAKIVLCLVIGILYSLGGRINKAIRRYIAPVVLVGGTIGLSLQKTPFNPLFLICIPLYIGAFSLGYGSDSTIIKVLKRLMCALAILVAGLPIVIITGGWWLFIIQGIICIATCIILGVKNPLPASVEELLIGFLTTIIFPFYV